MNQKKLLNVKIKTVKRNLLQTLIEKDVQKNALKKQENKIQFKTNSSYFL